MVDIVKCTDHLKSVKQDDLTYVICAHNTQHTLRFIMYLFRISAYHKKLTFHNHQPVDIVTN